MATDRRIRRRRPLAHLRGCQALAHPSAQTPKMVSMAMLPPRVPIASGKNHSEWESLQHVLRDSQPEAVRWMGCL
jgi:hypothetical protein